MSQKGEGTMMNIDEDKGWPAFVKLGAKVHYHPLRGGPHDGQVHVVKAIGYLGGDATPRPASPADSRVAWLRGKPGCVAVWALSPAGDCQVAR